MEGRPRGGGWGGGRGQGRNRAPLNVGRNAPSRVGARSRGRPQRYSRPAALRWLLPQPGHPATDRGPLEPTSPEADIDILGSWVGAAARIPAASAVRHRARGAERGPQQRSRAVGAQSCSSRAGQPQSPHLRGLGSSRYPRSHLKPFASAPAPGIDQAWFPGRPPGSTQPVRCSSGRTSRGVLSRREVLSRGREETRCVNARCNQRALLRGEKVPGSVSGDGDCALPPAGSCPGLWGPIRSLLSSQLGSRGRKT